MPMVGAGISRRAFAMAVTALALRAGDDGWIDLFDGGSSRGWAGNGVWKVSSGALAAVRGPADFFYQGHDKQRLSSGDFELEADLITPPGCQSALWLRASRSAEGSPTGLRICLGRSAAAPHARTGSLESLRYLYKPFITDGKRFRIQVAVRAQTVQVRLNGMMVVSYTGSETSIPSSGTIALSTESADASAQFLRVRARPLPEESSRVVAAPEDDVARHILELGRRNIPMADLHVHLKSGLTAELAIGKSMRDGLEYGIAVNCGAGNAAQNDQEAMQFIESLQGQPCFVAMQAEGREWTQMFTREAAARFDYIFTDSMTWSDNRGKRMRLWMPEEVGTISNVQEFMDTLVDRTVGILEREPIDIYVNPTYLPDQIAAQYEQLWTESRRRRVIQAAVRNRVAIELNTRRSLPSPSFIRMAKAGGAKFTFGTNNAGPEDLARCEYGLRMVDECGLTADDFFVPLESEKAIDRKGAALKG